MGPEDDNRLTPVYGCNAIVNPSVPFTGVIRRLQVGELISIQGNVPAKASGFTMELQFVLPDGKIERILHVSVRLERKEIVRNTMLSGKWGPEERFGGLGPLRLGHLFQCVILVHSEHFKIAFNGQHYADYRHRTNYGSVNSLHVGGVVELHSISFQSAAGSRLAKGAANAMPMLPAEEPDSLNQAVSTFPVRYGDEISMPYFEYVAGGLRPDRCIYLSGKVGRRAKRFEVNLKVGSSRNTRDIAFHMSSRFDDPDTPGGKNVVCNSFLGNKWGKEERLECEFPYQLGVHFDVLIVVEPNFFKVSVNNTHLLTFNHRCEDLGKIKGLEVVGDARIIHARLH